VEPSHSFLEKTELELDSGHLIPAVTARSNSSPNILHRRIAVVGCICRYVEVGSSSRAREKAFREAITEAVRNTALLLSLLFLALLFHSLSPL
jgi:hypothetical protein